jgi:uncharacterized protein involved in exopolysaccharide biosynthesis
LGTEVVDTLKEVPKRKLIIAVSAISSLFAGVFLAFLVEWWSKVKKG